MPIPFMCPNCGVRTLVDDQWAGFSGPCADCGQTIVVPSENIAAAAARPGLGNLAYGRNFGNLLGGAAILVAVLISLTALYQLVMAPTYQAWSAWNARKQCQANLRRIGLAMLQYEKDYGCLPPPFIADSAGQPMHSWRVLILPYLGRSEKALYNEYDFSLPWNDPANASVGRTMPRVFASPGDPNALANQLTSYFVLVGDNTAFHPKGVCKLSEITDARHQTILAYEVAGGKTHWLEPDDPAETLFDYSIGGSLGGCHQGGVNVVMADGSVVFLPDTTAADEIDPLFTIAGGESTAAP